MFTDTEPPVIANFPGDITANNDPGQPYAVIVWAEPTATDNSGGMVSLTSNYHPGDTFSIGRTNVTYIAIDTSGNKAVNSFTVTILGKSYKCK